MNCQQFQEVLPYIIETGGNVEQEEHLRSCESCAALVQDLKYIAEQAKLLLPMHDPNPRVWTSIEQSLQREGLVQEGRLSLLGQYKKTSTQTKSWTPLGWILAAAAVVLLGAALLNMRESPVPPRASADASAPAFDSDDQQLLNGMDDPQIRSAYETNLREANAYISDAQKAAADDPNDASAQETLMDAYQQKAMLYEMATARSLQ